MWLSQSRWEVSMSLHKYKAYPAYKDSGVEWLGKVPVQWKVLGGKRIFITVRKPAFNTDEQLAASQKYGVVPRLSKYCL